MVGDQNHGRCVRKICRLICDFFGILHNGRNVMIAGNKSAGNLSHDDIPLGSLLERVHETLFGLLAPPDPHLVLPGPLTWISAVGLK